MKHIVKPDEKGSPCFGYIPKHVLKPGDMVSLDKCFRCFGGFIYLKRKDDKSSTEVPELAIFAFHINPGRQSYIKEMKKHLFGYIYALERDYNFTKMIRCGGKLDSPQNEYLFKMMKRNLEDCLVRKFPNLPIEGFYPNSTTQ